MRLVAVLLVVVLLATVAQPARAEAFDPQTIGIIAGAAVAAALLVAVVVIGTTRDMRKGDTAVVPWEQNGDDVVILGPSTSAETPAAAAEPGFVDAGAGLALAAPTAQTP
jgi:hypothetical protein